MSQRNSPPGVPDSLHMSVAAGGPGEARARSPVLVTKRRERRSKRGGSPESVEEALHAAGGLVLQHLDAAFHLQTEDGRGREVGGWSDTDPTRCQSAARTHVDFGGLCEGAHGVHVVVEDDDPDHDPQAEGHRLLAGEAAAVLPARRRGGGVEEENNETVGSISKQANQMFPQ